MTAHEEILARLVSGGPVPLEVARHADACPECREELAALREVEAALLRARPLPAALSPPPPVRPLPVRRERRWSTVAAAAALALGLAGGFWAGRLAPAPALQPPSTQASGFLAADDSTFTLLTAAGALADEQPSTEEMADYFETHWGG